MSWPLIAARLERELGEPVRDARRLTPAKAARATWAARSRGAGELVVKVRHGDRADEKTQCLAAGLPLLGAQGYPVPEIVWHGSLGDDWYVVVQRRLPGRPIMRLTGAVARCAAGARRASGRGRDCGGRPGLRRLYHERAAGVAGAGGLRCLASYRALAHLADNWREGQPADGEATTPDFAAVLGRLRAQYG